MVSMNGLILFLFRMLFIGLSFRAMENKTVPVDHELVNDFRKINSITEDKRDKLLDPLDVWWRLKKGDFRF